MLEPIRELKRRVEAFDRSVKALRSVRVDRSDIRDAARELIDFYFRVVRDSLVEGGISDEHITRADMIAHELLETTHRRATVASYRKSIKALDRSALDFEKLALIGTQQVGGRMDADATDKRIVETLKALLPSAALSYEQAITDIQTARLSWRGPATDLREALRETLDHLAPDKDVTSQEGFRLEAGTNGPTMKQKVRFILKNRGAPKSVMQAPEAAVEAVDEAVGTFVRSVYTRSNVSTHTPTDRAEVLRVRDWVRVALCELLAI